MASFFPDLTKTRVVFSSRAEELFYAECRRTLGAQWRVFYSCTLSSLEGEAGLKENEIDFVLYHPRYGVVVVEVKGGRIRFDKNSNNFFSVNRHGQEFSIKNPFQQALHWKSRFLRSLKERGIRVPVSQAVCFPNVSESEFPRVSGIEPETILDRHKLANLEQSLKDLVKALQPEKFLRFDDVGAQLEDLLVGRNFCTKLYVRDYIDSHEQRVLDVQGFQDSFVLPVASARRLGIEGEAGTGKTVLAARLAQYFRDHTQSVLLLTSNQMLNDHLQSIVGTSISIKSYFDLAEDYGVNLLQPALDYQGSRDDWMQLEAPARLLRAMTQVKNSFDVIICDEAQDVQPFWWDIVEKLLNAQNKENRLYVLFDRSQGIFGSGGGGKSFVPEDVLPVPPNYFPMVHNYRTTREIATFARAFRTGRQILESHSARLGYLPQIIYYKTEAEGRALLATLVGTLTQREGLAPNEITVLSARRPLQQPSIIANVKEIAGLPLHVLMPGKSVTASGKDREQMLPVSTVGAFKGLETKVAILINFSEYQMPLSNPIMASLMYVASTRAKHLLYVLVKHDDDKRPVLEAALRSIKQSGGIVIDPTDPEYEVVGEVIHYDPERVGWLAVADPQFPQGNVMFFPTDVAKAKIARLRVGDKIKFRPRVEGHATIASDLKHSS